MKATVPADFTLRYEWHEGSVPPPYHYEYVIRLGPGPEGEVTFYPDYPQHDPPIWREPFTSQPSAVAGLYALMAKVRMFTRRWQRAERQAIGGSVSWLQVQAGQRVASVPAGLLPRDAEAIRPVYEAIRALVPQPIWDKLMSQYAQVQSEHAER